MKPIPTITKFISIPGINGLGHTNFTRNFAQVLIPNIETIPLDRHDIEKQQAQIYQQAQLLIPKYKKIFFIGGDHSISYPIGKAFHEYCKTQNKTSALIIFDAHADCMPPLPEPTHEEWLSALIQETKIPTIIIGLRKIEKVESEFIKSNNIITIINQHIKNNLDNQINIIKQFCKNKNLYISFDIDALDPKIAPATHYTEPNGLSLKQTLDLIKAIPKKNIKLIDLVEIHTNHPKENLQITLDSAKEIINSFLDSEKYNSSTALHLNNKL